MSGRKSENSEPEPKMNLLAIDTATERCSVALRFNGQWFERSLDTPRGHADIVLSMVDEVLRDAQASLRDLAGIAYGRGPGAFTGVRIAIGVVQGLAFGAQLPTVGISNLAAVANQAPSDRARILVCMDARMGEVYWAAYKRGTESAPLILVSAEAVAKPSEVDAKPEALDVAIGSGFAAYPELAERFQSLPIVAALPRARDIAELAEPEFRAGRTGSAFEVQPVYLRDRVTFVTPG
jgi:tRNA threonylcarbamoyladenosine biosynthesis protein TsaB